MPVPQLHLSQHQAASLHRCPLCMWMGGACKPHSGWWLPRPCNPNLQVHDFRVCCSQRLAHGLALWSMHSSETWRGTP